MIAVLLSLAVSADPAHLRLGLDARASLAVECPRVPELNASTGSIDDLQKDGARWVATYRPPRGAIPRVALVGVLCGEEAALLSIPLWGDGDAEVHARAHAVVSVRIGNEQFGPLRTDATGVARVPVVVPPGIDFATQGLRQIDLHVPRTRTVHLVVREGEVAVDRARTVFVYAFVADRTGAPRDQPALRWEATRGQLGDEQRIAAGVVRVRWTFEPGAPGEAVVRAFVEDDPEPAELALPLVAGAPAQIALTSDRPELQAGDGPLRLRAEVRDATGNLLEAPLSATANLGVVRHHGRELEVEVPAVLGGQRELLVAVSSRGVRAEHRVALRPAPPAVVRVVAALPNVLADGRSAVRLRLRALDRFGNEVSDAPAASSNLGSISAAARTSRGWEATFVAPVLHDPASARVRVRTGAAAGDARIELDPAVRPFAVSVRGGYFTNFHEVTGPMAGVAVAARTDLFGVQAGVQLSFDALGWSTTDALPTSSTRVAEVHTALAVGLPGAALELRQPLSDRSALWVEAGPTLAIASSRTEIASIAMRDRGTSWGGQAGLGAEVRAWRGRALFEARWLTLQPFSMLNLQGRLAGLCATAGYRLELF